MKKQVLAALLMVVGFLPAYSQGSKAKAAPIAPAPEITIDKLTFKIGMTKPQVRKQFDLMLIYTIPSDSEDDTWFVFKGKEDIVAFVTFKNNKVVRIEKHLNRYLTTDHITSYTSIIYDELTQFIKLYGNNLHITTNSDITNGIIKREIQVMAPRRTFYIQSVDYSASSDNSKYKTTIDIQEIIQ